MHLSFVLLFRKSYLSLSVEELGQVLQVRAASEAWEDGWDFLPCSYPENQLWRLCQPEPLPAFIILSSV